jgi:transcription termination factor Rho
MLMPSRKESGYKQKKDIPVFVMSSLDHLVDYDTFLQQVQPQSEYDAMNNLYYVSSDQVKKLNETHGISVEELLEKPSGSA